jgi:hypothetical protein
MSLSKAFNNHMKEFIEDIVLVFPKDAELKTTQFFLESLIRTKPRAVLEIWKTKINDKYQKEIELGNYDFFINKNYSEDVEDNSNDSMKSIEKMQMKISNMSEANKVKAMKYVQNLTKLCNLYYINKH